MARASRQLSFADRPTWGGRRKGAGRPRVNPRACVPHRARAGHKRDHPVHITLRAQGGLPSLRSERVFTRVRDALVAHGTSKTRLSVVHFSVQDDHVHLIVEAPDSKSLYAGASGLAIRLARAINGALGRTGRVWGDRYHVSELESPRQVRHALVYVLLNFKKHIPGSRGVDPCSSGMVFDGWDRPPAPAGGPLHLPAPRTWLLRRGWRRHGLIGAGEAPAPAPAAVR